MVIPPLSAALTMDTLDLGIQLGTFATRALCGCRRWGEIKGRQGGVLGGVNFHSSYSFIIFIHLIHSFSSFYQHFHWHKYIIWSSHSGPFGWQYFLGEPFFFWGTSGSFCFCHYSWSIRCRYESFIGQDHGEQPSSEKENAGTKVLTTDQLGLVASVGNPYENGFY